MTVPFPAVDTRAAAGARVRRRARTSDPVAYDFRRPIQLSREHARILQLGLDGFARQATTVFTSALRTVCQVTLASIDQQSYAEYVESLGSTTYMVKFTADPIPGTCVLEMPLTAAMESLDHMLGGPGGPNQPQRPLTDIESSVVRTLVDRLLKEMRYSLEGIVALEPAFTAVEYSPQFAQAAAAGDVMVVSTFELKVDDNEHRISLCMPFTGVLPHLVRAAAPSPASERERVQRAQAARLLQQQFEEVPVEVSVGLRTTRMGPAEISGVAVGDVLRLSHPAAAPLDVTVGETTFAHATPGAHGKRLAALIVAPPQA